MGELLCLRSSFSQRSGGFREAKEEEIFRVVATILMCDDREEQRTDQKRDRKGDDKQRRHRREDDRDLRNHRYKDEKEQCEDSQSLRQRSDGNGKLLENSKPQGQSTVENNLSAAVSNLGHTIPELFLENLIRGRGLFCRSCMKSQMASPILTNVFAALFAVVNTKFPEVGELILRRIVLQLKRAYERNDKPQLLAAVKFIAHLVNQQVAHEIVALNCLLCCWRTLPMTVLKLLWAL